MTAPLALPAGDRHWILRYIGLQKASDKRVRAALEAALDSAGAALSALEGKPGVSAQVRRAQLLGNQGALSQSLAELFKELGNIIRADQAEAAGLAAKLLYEDEKKIWAIIERDPDKRTQIEESMEAKARRNVQSMMTRILHTSQPLSKRIYKSEALSKHQVGRVVNVHLARGSSAAELSRDVRRFFNPNVAGGVSHSAKRLARTEINNAFHAQSISDMQERPWINQVNWNLSKSHPVRENECLCETYARMGTFPANAVPKKPHPNCLCSVTPVVPDFETAYNNFMSGQYGNYLKDL